MRILLVAAAVPLLVTGQFYPNCKGDLDLTNCPDWAAAGFCNSQYADYMATNCCTSCGYTLTPTMQATEIPTISPTSPDEYCQYEDQSNMCTQYANQGFCLHTHVAWMQRSCRASCECFGGTEVEWTEFPSTPPTVVPTMMPTKREPCMDNAEFKADVADMETCNLNVEVGYCDVDHPYHWFMIEFCWYTCYCGPTQAPTLEPTDIPTVAPTLEPTDSPTAAAVECAKIRKRGKCKAAGDQCVYDVETGICYNKPKCGDHSTEDACLADMMNPRQQKCFWYGEAPQPYCADRNVCQKVKNKKKCQATPEELGCVVANRGGAYGGTCQKKLDISKSSCGNSVKLKGTKSDNVAQTYDLCDCKRFCESNGDVGYEMTAPKKHYQKTKCKCFSEVTRTKSSNGKYYGGTMEMK